MSTAIATATAAMASFETTAFTPDSVRGALAGYQENPASETALNELLACRRAVAEMISELPPAQKSGANLDWARSMLRSFAASGAADLPVTAEDLDLAERYHELGWPGLLAAMLLVPAWQWPGAPELASVPTWLWSDFAEYVFQSPQGFTDVGQAEAYAEHALKRLSELAKAVTANRGSTAVRSAVEKFIQVSSGLPLYFSADSLRRHMELRGQILTVAAGVKPDDMIVPRSREGRKLRVGFVNMNFAAHSQTYSTLPTFEELDSERFEVHAFVCESAGDALEAHVRKSVASFTVLSGSLEDQVSTLRTADLDVLVFGTNVTATVNAVTRLALYRVAPLQVVSNSSCVTSGLREIDMYLSGELTEAEGAAAHFTERLALRAGPGHAFNYSVNAQEASMTWTRSALGIPEGVPVFVSAANYYKITPEIQHVWAKILAAVPESRLLVHPFNPNWSSSYPIKRFAAQFEEIMAKYGVAADRLLISSEPLPSRAEVKELLRVGDVYLDTYPFGSVNSVIDPLQITLPVVALEGDISRSRIGSAVLRALDLAELVATDEKGYIEVATCLARDNDIRTALRARIGELLQRTPVFLDSLAASDTFGAVIEKAFDEMYFFGREAFRQTRDPVRVGLVTDVAQAIDEAVGHFSASRSSDALVATAQILGAMPLLPIARQLMGAVLIRSDRAERAVKYLVGAIEHDEGNPGLWYDVAIALKRSGQLQPALQALQTCLRMDPNHPDRHELLATWTAEALDPAVLLRNL